MCLATVAANGQPSTRVVVLKGFSKEGLVFYTNYESRKAIELESNPRVSVNFLWLPLQRQINITGRVERVSKVEALKYFVSRPFASRLGAWSSPQSQVITSRQILEAKLDQMKRKFADGEVPLPDHWGGYRIVPETFEFWQGGGGRLHDRFMYRLDDADQWASARLAP
jgi:pyridoxamine 5'-phosphate oxidase